MIECDPLSSIINLLSGAPGIFRKQFFHGQIPPQHPLLAGELDQILHVVMVFFQALIEWILAEKLSFFFQIRPAPGEAQAGAAVP